MFAPVWSVKEDEVASPVERRVGKPNLRPVAINRH